MKFMVIFKDIQPLLHLCLLVLFVYKSGDVVYMDWKLSKDSDSGKFSGKTGVSVLHIYPYISTTHLCKQFFINKIMVMMIPCMRQKFN